MSDDESTPTQARDLDNLLSDLSMAPPDDAEVSALIASLLEATEDAVMKHELELAAALKEAETTESEGPPKADELTAAPPAEIIDATKRRQLVLLSEVKRSKVPTSSPPTEESYEPEPEPVIIGSKPKKKGVTGLLVAALSIGLLGAGAYLAAQATSETIDLGNVDKRIEDEVARGQAIWTQAETCLKGCKEDPCDTQCVAPLIAVLDKRKLKEIEALVAQRRIDRKRDAMEDQARQEADKLGGTAAQAEKKAADERAEADPKDGDSPKADAKANAPSGDPGAEASPKATSKAKKKKRKKRKKRKKKGFF